jgi:hypothetical protein
MAEWKWNEIGLPALNNLLSTGQLQALPPSRRPGWMQNARGFAGAWITPLDGPQAASSGVLSSGLAQAELLAERRDPKPPTHRYYRYIYCQLIDGRVFQGGPSKDIDFGHHLNSRPPWLGSPKSTST